MAMRIIRTLAGAAVVVAALAACSGPGGTSGGYGSDTTPTPSQTATPSAGASASGDLAVADSSLGQIVVDGDGMTVYVFDTDTQGSNASACTGQCAEKWPAVETTSDAPSVEGVTGQVATITGIDGGKQLTINGWPIYTYAGDSAAGDVAGQGVGGIWWAISPNGDKITTTG
jgi:predicted lipoprotein with Yx(FWY)xxD motif